MALWLKATWSETAGVCIVVHASCMDCGIDNAIVSTNTGCKLPGSRLPAASPPAYPPAPPRQPPPPTAFQPWLVAYSHSGPFASLFQRLGFVSSPQ